MKKYFIILSILLFTAKTFTQNNDVGCITDYKEIPDNLDQRGGKYLTSLGDLKVLIVFAKFKDDNKPHPHWPINSYPSEMNKFIDDNLNIASNHFINLTNYYNQMSFGNFRVTGKVIGAETPYPIDHYIPENTHYPIRSLANKDILKVIDDSVDFREYDNWTYVNNYNHKNVPDSVIEMVVIIWRGLVFADNWSGESSLGDGPDLFVENGQIRIKMGFGGYFGMGTFGSGVTVQYWGERSPERNFKVVIHEIAHWLIGSEHPYSAVNHSFWGMLTLAGESVCANSFERERLKWLDVHLIEQNILSAQLSDFVTTPSAYKYHPPNGYLGEMFYFENHQLVSIYDNVTSNPDDKGIFVLHFANSYYLGDCVRIITSDGFWKWESPSKDSCWGNELPSFKKQCVDRNGLGNRDRIKSQPDSSSDFLYSYINEYNQAECNDWLHGYGFNNSFNKSFNDLFSPWSNPPAKTWFGELTDFSMQVLNEFNSIITVCFVVQNSIGLKPSKPILGWNPRFSPSLLETGLIHLAWGADFWDGNPIEHDVNWSELQRKIGESDEWNTIYLGKSRCWTDSSSIYLSTFRDTIYFRVRVRDSQNLYAMWSELFNTKMIVYNVTSFEEHFLDINTPTLFLLFQNYPNPFNPTTKISWQSPVGSQQTIKVFDVLGNEVTTLVDEYKPAGKYEVAFSIYFDEGRKLSSGVYFYQLSTANYTAVKKMILLR
jgi:M6 family metalloprotease-like protein